MMNQYKIFCKKLQAMQTPFHQHIHKSPLVSVKHIIVLSKKTIYQVGLYSIVVVYLSYTLTGKYLDSHSVNASKLGDLLDAEQA